MSLVNIDGMSYGNARKEFHIKTDNYDCVVPTHFSAGYVYEIMAVAYRPTSPAYRLQIVQAVVWLNGEDISISTLKDDMITHSGSDIDITISLDTTGGTITVNVTNCADGNATVVFKQILKIPVLA